VQASPHLRWEHAASYNRAMKSSLLALALAACVSMLSGCAVVAVADVGATVVVKTAGLAADAAIGTVRLTGKAVGAAADLVLPSSN